MRLKLTLIVLLNFTTFFMYGSCKDFYVSLNGKDSNSGTINNPFASIENALETIRRERIFGFSGNYTINIREGIYNLNKTILLTPADSSITFKAYNGEKVTISGGLEISDWKRLDDQKEMVSSNAKGKIWVASIPKNWLFHYLYVNGNMAERSKSDHRHWREWNKDHSFGITDSIGQEIHFKDGSILKYLHNGDSEMVCITMQFGVMGNGVIQDIDSVNKTIKWTSKQFYPTFMESRDPYERGYRFENALYLIDRPGEWAVNSKLGKVYYWPKENEDITKAKVIAPRLYELVRLQGDENRSLNVKNVCFDGISFVYTDRLPEDKWPDSWLTRQWEIPDAALFLNGTENCVVRNCRILYSGSYGITMKYYCQNNVIEKNEIGWTGSGGILLEGYGPGTLDVNKNNIITRNYIHDHGFGNYWHSPCIQIYQSGYNTISYNLLQRSGYNAISMVGIRYDTMNDPDFFFPQRKEAGYLWWKQYRIRYHDFSPSVQKRIKDRAFSFDRETVKPYLHSNNNLIEYNIISEPQLMLNEGGAIYAFGIGKWNRWLNNITFKSSGMPASSVYALDNLAEYTTIKNNIIWVNGIILNSIGSRPEERGNEISDNVRVYFNKKLDARFDRDKEGTWYVNETGRKSLDQKLNFIIDIVNKKGGWPEGANYNIPDNESELPQANDTLGIPEGAHVTIE